MRITTFLRIGSLSSIGLVLAGALAIPTFAENKKLDSVGLTVGDLANPFLSRFPMEPKLRRNRSTEKSSSPLSRATTI